MYQGAAGQVFNLSKSQLFVGKCGPLRRQTIFSSLNIPLATLPSSYLGVPFFLGSPNQQHFKKLIFVLRSKFEGWKMKSLSFAGHLILVNHVLTSIPMHTSLTIPLPKKTTLQIEKLMRNFLWCSHSY